MAEVIIAIFIVTTSILGIAALSADIMRNIHLIDLEIAANSIAKKNIEAVKNLRDGHLKENPFSGFYNFSKKLPVGTYRIEYDNLEKVFRFFDITDNLLSDTEKQDLKPTEIAVLEKWGGPLNRYGEIDDSTPIKFYLKLEVFEGINPYISGIANTSGSTDEGTEIKIILSDDMEPIVFSGHTNLDGEISDEDEKILVDSASGIEVGDILSIDDNDDGADFSEDLLVLSKNGDELGVKRGYRGTTITSHPDDSRVNFSKLERYLEIKGVGTSFGRGVSHTWANAKELLITLGEVTESEKLVLTDKINPKSILKNLAGQEDATGESGIPVSGEEKGYSLLKKALVTVVWNIGASEYDLSLETSIADLSTGM